MKNYGRRILSRFDIRATHPGTGEEIRIISLLSVGGLYRIPQHSSRHNRSAAHSFQPVKRLFVFRHAEVVVVDRIAKESEVSRARFPRSCQVPENQGPSSGRSRSGSG